ncbi:MAG TPA: hypothetical protein V6D18_04915 [Thermosynechococcaceae cyanobacterium]
MGKRKAVSWDVWKPLLARSGNRCAFPGCSHSVVNEKNKLVAQLCHIEAVAPGGQRYNDNQTDEERNGYDNLLFLCYGHHVETDDTSEYPVQRLREIKYEHESQFVESPFEIDMSVAYILKEEMEAYWSDVEELHTFSHRFDELKVPVNSKALFKELFADVRELLSEMSNLCDLMRIRDRQRGDVHNWEIYTFGIPNRLKRTHLVIIQSEIKYLEEYLVLNSSDLSSKARLGSLKEEFKQLAQQEIYLD